MKQILVLLALSAMLVCSCSSGDDSPVEETPKYKLDANSIVGVWRSGDYWVSFSEDGFYSAFFNIGDNERIDDGDYTIDGDVVTIKNYEHTTELSLKALSSASMTFDMTYNYPLTSKKVTQEMSFSKADGIPCKADDILVGKSFSYDDVSESHGGKIITFTNILCDDRIILTEYSEKNSGGESMQWRYYVYLPPCIYHVRISSGYYPEGSVIKIGKISEFPDGTLSYEKIR
ncbi:MAG: hypothetical protein IJ155_10880 [Prevotella sp.]|nr:hypothetical protein [Prevotella sp.]